MSLLAARALLACVQLAISQDLQVPLCSHPLAYTHNQGYPPHMQNPVLALAKLHMVGMKLVWSNEAVKTGLSNACQNKHQVQIHSNKAAVNEVCSISFYVKCITENQNTQHFQSDALRVHSCSCFLTWLYLEVLPVPLCYWWYILSTEDMSTVLWRVCATNAALTVKKGMNSRGCRSVKCLHASSLNLSLCRYQSFNPYLFVRCLGIWLP